MTSHETRSRIVVRRPHWLVRAQHLTAGCCLTAAVLLCTSAAHAQTKPPSAQDAPPADRDRALSLFEDAKKAYQEGDFKKAVELLETARALVFEPVLIYNLGRALDGAGEWNRAADAYEEYLASGAEIADRGALIKRVEQLRQLAKKDTVDPEAPPPEKKPDAKRPPPPPPQESSPSRVPWIVAGVGAVGVGIGAVLGGVALSKHSDAENAPSQAEAAEGQSSAEGIATGSTVAFVAGGVLVAAGVTWGVVDIMGSGSSSESASASIYIGATDVSLRGRF